MANRPYGMYFTWSITSIPKGILFLNNNIFINVFIMYLTCSSYIQPETQKSPLEFSDSIGFGAESHSGPSKLPPTRLRKCTSLRPLGVRWLLTGC